MGPDAASVRRRSIDACRSGERDAFRLGGKWLGLPCPFASAATCGARCATVSTPRTSRLRASIASASAWALLVRDFLRSPTLPDRPGEPVQGGKRFGAANRGQKFNCCHRPFSKGRDNLPISKAPCPVAGRTSPLPGEQGPPAEKHSSATRKTSRFCVDTKLRLWEICLALQAAPTVVTNGQVLPAPGRFAFQGSARLLCAFLLHECRVDHGLHGFTTRFEPSFGNRSVNSLTGSLVDEDRRFDETSLLPP